MTTDAPPLAPHAEPPDVLTQRLEVSPGSGLSTADIAARRARYGANVLKQQRSASVFEILLNQLKSPIVLILVAAAVLAFSVREWIDALAIVAVLVLNTLIGFFTEFRALRSMEALQRLSSRSVRVRRDGASKVIPADDLVPGDIVILDAGDVVAADLRVLQAANLASDESALTGESLPVAKSVEPVAPQTILAERRSMLHKGCAITRGTGEGLVISTGMATELGRITRLVEESEPERSPLEHQLQRLSRDLIWITLAVAAAVGAAGILAGGELALMVETAVALAVAAIPEGLPIVATLALARGMLRMARHDALMRRLSAVETLGATTVILTDKTGTLTENSMHVDRIVTTDGEITLDRAAHAYQMDGELLDLPRQPTPTRLLTAATLCNNAALSPDGTGGVGDPMEIALLEAALAGGLRRADLLSGHPEVKEYAFDSDAKMMATVHKADEGFLVAVKGAPESVFRHVTSLDRGSETVAFEGTRAQNWRQTCDLLAEQGLRLLAVAGKRVTQADAEPYDGLTLYGVIALQDPPRADVATALGEARRAGIKVVMVTGDHARTAKSISDAVHLAPATAEVIEGANLKALASMSEQEREAARHGRVFSRVAPEQKLDLVALHQMDGEVVAMTGDGVNDAPALRKAEIGIAMGRRGTQVAREAADMVLRDDAFATIILAIREGRIIYTNIRRFTTYLLSCNLSEILVIGLAVAAGAPLPLLPLQILFLNLVTDVFPALALGTIEADNDVLARAPRDPGEPILTARQWRSIVIHGLSISVATLAALAAAYAYGLTGDELTTMCFFTLALAQLLHVFNMRNWRERLVFNQLTRNRYVWLALLVCAVILVAAVFEPHLAGVLRIVPLPPEAWATIVGLSFVPVVLREVAAIVVRFRRRLQR